MCCCGEEGPDNVHYADLSDVELRQRLEGPCKRRRARAKQELQKRGITINYAASRRTSR